MDRFPRGWKVFILLAAALFSLVGESVGRAAEIPAPKRKLVIGKVSNNPKAHYRELMQMAEYAVSQMGDLGITEAEVLMARDHRQMINYLKQGMVDWVSETPLSAMLFMEKGGAKLLLRRWQSGVGEYSSIFFVRRDSGIETLSDLVGKTIAFKEPGSTTGFLVPAAILLERGLTLNQQYSPRDQAPADRVGYIFANQEINIATLVHKGLADAGAFSNLDWEKDSHNPSAFRQDFKIIYTSESFPRALELVRGDLEPEIRKRLKQILLRAHQSSKGRAVLREYEMTLRFDELDETVLKPLRGYLSVLRRRLPL